MLHGPFAVTPTTQIVFTRVGIILVTYRDHSTASQWVPMKAKEVRDLADDLGIVLP